MLCDRAGHLEWHVADGGGALLPPALPQGVSNRPWEVARLTVVRNVRGVLDHGRAVDLLREVSAAVTSVTAGDRRLRLVCDRWTGDEGALRGVAEGLGWGTEDVAVRAGALPEDAWERLVCAFPPTWQG